MDEESQIPPTPTWLKWMPVVSVCLATYSALFATFILYPWHVELSKEFAEKCSKNYPEVLSNGLGHLH
jgi:hypothetical protein